MTFRIMDIDYIKRRGRDKRNKKEGKGRKMRENDKKRTESLHMSKKSSTFVPKLRECAQKGALRARNNIVLTKKDYYD